MQATCETEHTSITYNEVYDCWHMLRLDAREEESASSGSGTESTHYIVVCDVSGSMNKEQRLVNSKASMCYLAEKLGDDDYLSVITYSDWAKTDIERRRMGCASTLQQTLDQIQAIETRGVTSFLKALEELEKLIRSVEENTVIVFLTDGHPFVPKTTGTKKINTESASQTLEYLSAHPLPTYCSLYTIGYGEGHNSTMLSNMAQVNASGGKYYYVNSQDDIAEVMASVIMETKDALYTDLRVRIKCMPRFRLQEFDMNRHKEEIVKEKEYLVSLGNLCRGSMKHLLFRTTVAQISGAEEPMPRYIIEVNANELMVPIVVECPAIGRHVPDDPVHDYARGSMSVEMDQQFQRNALAKLLGQEPPCTVQELASLKSEMERGPSSRTDFTQALLRTVQSSIQTLQSARSSAERTQAAHVQKVVSDSLRTETPTAGSSGESRGVGYSETVVAAMERERAAAKRTVSHYSKGGASRAPPPCVDKPRVATNKRNVAMYSTGEGARPPRIDKPRVVTGKRSVAMYSSGGGEGARSPRR